MNRREAKRFAHALIAEIVDREVDGVGAFGGYGLSEKDEERVSEAVRELLCRHQRASDYQSPGAIAERGGSRG